MGLLSEAPVHHFGSKIPHAKLLPHLLPCSFGASLLYLFGNTVYKWVSPGWAAVTPCLVFLRCTNPAWCSISEPRKPWEAFIKTNSGCCGDNLRWPGSLLCTILWQLSTGAQVWKASRKSSAELSSGICMFWYTRHHFSTVLFTCCVMLLCAYGKDAWVSSVWQLQKPTLNSMMWIFFMLSRQHNFSPILRVNTTSWSHNG